jgi:hypothetical protein
MLAKLTTTINKIQTVPNPIAIKYQKRFENPCNRKKIIESSLV